MSARWFVVATITSLVATLGSTPNASAGGGGSRVASTPHNLSASGPGPVRAAGESEICVFCHTPHNAQPVAPLWNRELPSGPFVSYKSPSLDATHGKAAPQPGGASKLCLSCHDGTLALGAVTSRREEIKMLGTSGGRMPPHRPGYIGRDLSGAHPISIAVTDDLVARNNAKDSRLVTLPAMRTDPNVKLDANNRIQCTTCHDPHDDSNYGSSRIHFYAKPRFSDVCDVCHRL